jgi:solute carrier family 39 (zinc transporter), member 1/2/3
MSEEYPTEQPTGPQYVPSALSLNLRIGAVFIMFVASIFGVVAPLFFFAGVDTEQKISDSDNFRILRAFAAGTMMGVAFIHLLSDANSRLSEIQLVSDTYPPLAFTLATTGALMVLGFEQVAVAVLGGMKLPNESSHEAHNKPSHDGCESGNHHSNNSNSSSSDNGSIDVCGNPELIVVESNRIGDGDSQVRVCEHHHAISMIMGSSATNVIVKAYMMELSVAIHSIIIGVDLGSQSGVDNLPVLQALMIAISFHQFFEGLGLGATLQEAKVQLGQMKLIVFAISFALTVSIGIVIGICLTLNEGEAASTDQANYATGCLNALAAGILIYVSLVEMAAEDFQAASIARKTALKAKMMFALMLGSLFMAILALWA